jgi:uncharacterized membrane protein
MFSFDVPLHPSLVHFPIALLVLGAGAAILFRLMHRPAGEKWGVYSLLAGWLLTLPALITGLIDKSGIPVESPANQVANLHTTLMITMWVIFGGALYLYYIWQKKEQLNGGRLWIWFLLLILAVIVLTLAGHQGARLVYELSVGQSSGNHPFPFPTQRSFQCPHVLAHT